MAGGVKNIAIIGANKEGLKLLPILLADSSSKVVMIADANRDAMLFKLKELGYRLSARLDIALTGDLEDIKKIKDLDIVINALQDQSTVKFLESPEFKDVEKLAPLSTRLLWGISSSAKSATGHVSTNDQTALLSSFHEIVDVVRLTVDRKELLSVILKLATESTQAQRGSIMLFDREEGALRVEVAKGMDEEVVRKIRVPLGVGISGKVALEGKPLLISGKATEESFLRPMDRMDVKSSMSVPLILDGQVIGVINVSSSESSHAFTREDLNFLSSLAGLAAEVIHRSNEYERMRVDAAKFTFWRDVDSIMNSQLPFEKRLNAVARKIAATIPELTCFIYIYDEEADRLYLKASSLRDSKEMGIVSIRPGEAIEGYAHESLKDVFLVDRTEESALKRIYLSLPMISNGKHVGTFNCQMISARGLSIYNESFLKDVRNLIADSVYRYKEAEHERTRARKMFAVDEAGLETLSMSDYGKLSGIITTVPASIIGAEGALLRLRQPGTSKYQTAGTYGLEDKNVRANFMPLEKETVMEVLRKKNNVGREFSEDASPYIRSVLSHPFILDGQVAGILTLYNKSSEATIYPCAFSRNDEEILKRFDVYALKAITSMMGRTEAVKRPQPLRAVPATGERGPAAPRPVPAVQAKPVEKEAPAVEEPRGDGFDEAANPAVVEPAPFLAPPAVKSVESAPAGLDAVAKREVPAGGKVSTMALFEKRVEQELNRARRLDTMLLIATIRITGFKDQAAKGKAGFESRLINYLRKRMRSFDVVVKFNEETYGFLFLDIKEKLSRLPEAIAEMITSDEETNRALVEGKIGILYGYAAFPKDGDSFAELFTKASRRERISLNLNKSYDAESSEGL